jgi:membrane protein
MEDEALSRGAAIPFYTVTSNAPVLLIVIAIAGFVFGRERLPVPSSKSWVR